MKNSNLKRNKSSHFILPMIGYHVSKNSPLNYYLINSYVSEDYRLYLVLDNSNDTKLSNIIYQLQIHDSFRNCEYGDDNNEIILEFEIPDEYKSDFDLFTKGLYSQFSLKFKEILCAYYSRVSSRKERDEKGKPIINTFDAIYPSDEKMKDMSEYYNVDLKIIKECGEVLDPPNIEKESFKKVTELYGIEQQST